MLTTNEPILKKDFVKVVRGDWNFVNLFPMYYDNRSAVVVIGTDTWRYNNKRKEWQR